jgi:ElaB/YqjD/DUF883 family membrane-anchored ribosome-binding protein
MATKTATPLERQKRELDKTVDSVSETVHGAVDSAAEAVSSSAGYVVTETDRWLEDGREYIRAKPYAVVAAAFVAGYLFRAIRG